MCVNISAVLLIHTGGRGTAGIKGDPGVNVQGPTGMKGFPGATTHCMYSWRGSVSLMCALNENSAVCDPPLGEFSDNYEAKSE